MMAQILCALAALAAAPWVAGVAAAPYVSSNSFIDEECPSRSVPGLGSPTSVLVVTAHDVWAYDGATGAHEHVAAAWAAGAPRPELVAAFVVRGDAWVVANGAGGAFAARVDEAAGVLVDAFAVPGVGAASDAVKVGGTLWVADADGAVPLDWADRTAGPRVAAPEKLRGLRLRVAVEGDAVHLGTDAAVGGSLALSARVDRNTGAVSYGDSFGGGAALADGGVLRVARDRRGVVLERDGATQSWSSTALAAKILGRAPKRGEGFRVAAVAAVSRGEALVAGVYGSYNGSAIATLKLDDFGNSVAVRNAPEASTAVARLLSPGYACGGADVSRPPRLELFDGRGWDVAYEPHRREAENVSRYGFIADHFRGDGRPARIDKLDMLRESEAAMAPYATSLRSGDARLPHRHPLSLEAKMHPEPAKHLEDVYRARARVDTGPFRKWASRNLDEGMFQESWLRQHNAWMTGRDFFMNKFKPNVTSLILQFGTADTKTLFRYPFYTDALQRDVISPLLEAVGVNESRVTRLQLAHMPPRSQIRPHVDSGHWAESQHRVHIPLVVNGGVAFMSFINGAFKRVPVETGLAFEINNKIPHCVYNTGDSPRLHLLIDELPHDPPRVVHVLPEGAVCDYNKAAVETLPDSCVNIATSTYDPVERATRLAAERRRQRKRY